MNLVASSLALALALPLPAAQRGAQVEVSIPERLSELDRANPERARVLLGELLALGDDAGAAALAGSAGEFASLPLTARRARAQIAREAGGAHTVALALERLDDPDDFVRRSLVQLLAAPGRRTERAQERIAALELRATADPSDDVRTTAIRGLARFDTLEACLALERLLGATASRERAICAQALAGQPRAREIVVRVVQSACTSLPDRARSPLASDVLATLLAVGYGTSLAETQGGGSSPRDRAPFVHGALHRDPTVREAAQVALVRFLERTRALGEWRRADLVLAALQGAGLDDTDLLLRRATLALQVGEQPEVARDCAAELRRTAPLDNQPTTRDRFASAALVEAAADIALGDLGGARTALDAAEGALASLARERFDLRVETTGERRAAGAVEPVVEPEVELGVRGAVVEIAGLRGLVDVYRTLVLLAEGRGGGDPGVLARARDADQWLLEAQRSASRPWPPRRLSLDDLFAHRLGPSLLLFANPRSQALSRGRALELERALYEAFTTVTGGGVPGFEPADGITGRLADRVADPARRELLEQVQSTRHGAEDAELQRQWKKLEDAGALDQAQARVLLRQMSIVRFVQDREREEGLAALRRQIEPSQAGLTFADRLREHGRTDAARTLALAVKADLEKLRDTLPEIELTRALAGADLALGGALMDQNSPAEAETALLSALGRLESLERDPALRGDERVLAILRPQISNVLVSLAVNANVKLRRPEKALEYFERAYQLQQNDFLRVLLACYRARAGRGAEAREVLREVPISPSNYYNLACTYALLGEPDLALDFLQRDFDELRSSAGSRERQKEWARGDPDLESVRSDPRFQALVRPAEKARDG